MFKYLFSSEVFLPIAFPSRVPAVSVVSIVKGMVLNHYCWASPCLCFQNHCFPFSTSLQEAKSFLSAWQYVFEEALHLYSVLQLTEHFHKCSLILVFTTPLGGEKNCWCFLPFASGDRRHLRGREMPWRFHSQTAGECRSQCTHLLPMQWSFH